MALTLQNTLITEAVNIPSAVMAPMRAMLVGGNALLFRYGEAAERAEIGLGDYVLGVDTVYVWPGDSLPASGYVVDQDYVALHAEDALLLYYTNASAQAPAINPVAGYTDRVRCTGSGAVNFIDNTFRGTLYPHDATEFGDRDCAVGDWVYLEGVGDDNETYAIWTTIKGFDGEAAAAVVTPTVAYGGSNAAQNTSATSVDVAQTGGPDSGIQLSADVSAYDGSVLGPVTEIYTITVKTASSNNLTTPAVLHYTTASGVESGDVTTDDLGIPFAVGAQGLMVHLDYAWYDSLSSEQLAGTDIADLQVGQQWMITINQQFYPATATASGTYTGASDTTYIVRVSRGGEFAAPYPQITVSTDNGIDSYGPRDVASLSSAINVGTKGVKITFSGLNVDRLRKGDVYYVTAQAAGVDNMRTIILNNQLPTEIQSASKDLSMKLYVHQASTEIPHKHLDPAKSGDYSYTISTTGVTVEGGLYLTDPTITASGVLVPKPVESASLFLEYRAWVDTVADKIHTISALSDLGNIPGADHPDNPLRFAAGKAWAASGGLPVKYLAVADPSSTADWTDAIARLTGSRGFHDIVALTDAASVITDLCTHVISQSADEIGNYRALWVSPAMDTVVAVLTTASDDTIVQGTVSLDSGTGLYTVGHITTDGINLQTSVRAGDTLRTNYSVDDWLNVTYDEFEIASVDGADSYTLVSGPTTPLSEQKIEIWRSRTNDDLVAAWVALAESYGNWRIRLVCPDTAGDGTYSFSGQFVAAALAGMRSGIVPNRSLTNLEVVGITDVSTMDRFNNPQLDQMAEAGVWIVYHNDAGTVVTRQGLTCAGKGDYVLQEEMACANIDACHTYYQTNLEELYGQINTTADTMELTRLNVQGSMATLMVTRNKLLGPMLIEGEVTSVARSTLLDHVAFQIQETIPLPMNSTEIYSTIIA